MLENCHTETKMAEASAVQEGQRSSNFFCHQCSVEINPKLPEYTCPRCDNGFIEEITGNFDEQQNDQEHADPGAQFAELWGRTFLDNFRRHTGPDRGRLGSEDADGEGDDDMTDEDVVRQSPIRVFPGARIAFTRGFGGAEQGQERNQALQSIIEQLLSGLTGGAMLGAGRGGAMPIGINLPMYGNPGDYAWGSGGLDNIISQLLNQLDGAGPPPAPKEDIDNLPAVTITKEQVDHNLQCSVCMEDFKFEESVKQLPCAHVYHPDCIVPWLEMHGTCPICRKNLEGKDCDEHGNSIDSNTNSDNNSENPGPSGSTSSNGHSSTTNGPSDYHDFVDEYD